MTSTPLEISNVEEDEMAGSLNLTIPPPPEFLEQISLRVINEFLELNGEDEVKELLASDELQAAFGVYRDSYLRSHPRAPLPHPQGICNFFSLRKYFEDDPASFFEGLVEDYPDHADTRGAEFVWRALQFLVSDDCTAKFTDIADLDTWEPKKAYHLVVVILCVLQAMWQDQYRQSLRDRG